MGGQVVMNNMRVCKSYQEANAHDMYEQFEYKCDSSMFSLSDVCKVYSIFEILISTEAFILKDKLHLYS